ncbi:MAG: hypothetical protein LBJ59_09695 [Zoogloeaceae bacterium]|jgi:hypothetical protein|nr:hypothetical protein [Zoogloeaceae bacterium]
MKSPKFIAVLLFLAVAVFIAFDQGLFQKSIDLNRFSSNMGENEVKQSLPDIGLRCMDTEPGFPLGNRVCSAKLASFNGIEASQMAFFFKGAQLANFKIDIPWGNHQVMLDKLRKDYGPPVGEQDKPRSGIRLMGWKIKGGALLYNMDKDKNPEIWNALQWVGYKDIEATVKIALRVYGKSIVGLSTKEIEGIWWEIFSKGYITEAQG